MAGSAERFDVAVAGGGPAGAAAAITLARQGVRVLLLEAGDAQAPHIGEALPPAARPLLRDLGALDAVGGSGRHLRCPGNLSVWGAAEPATTDFLRDPNGHGWHLDRALFDLTLREVAVQSGAQVYERTAVHAETPLPDGMWLLHLRQADGTPAKVTARWIVDATGRRAVVARRHGARRTARDRLVARWARFRLLPASGPEAVCRDARTVVEAAPDGWWYTALLPCGGRVAAYHTDADLAGGPPRTTEAFQWLLHETRHVAPRFPTGVAELVEARTVAANSARLDPIAGDGWLATGDAVLSFDPLSSQGILTALFSGMQAGHAVAAHLSGDDAAFPAYASRVAAIENAYQRNHAICYGSETRWLERPFWRRRVRSRSTEERMMLPL